MPAYMPPPVDLKPGSVVWAYVRDSGGDSQDQSVPQQVQEIESYCSQYYLVLERIFKDVARSGTSVNKRDGFNDLIDTISTTNKRPDGLILWNFARFARELDDCSYYKAVIRKKNIRIHSMTDPIPDGQFGRVMEVILDIANEDKSRQTSRDAKRGLSARVKQGFTPGGGTPPRGYRMEKVECGVNRANVKRVGTQWVEDPDTWDLVQLAWKMRANGASYAEIQEATRENLYRSKSCWPSFFANKSYLGIGKCGELEVPDHHPAAIDPATWDKVQELQAAHPGRGKVSRVHHPRRVAYPALLSGNVVCIHCGAAMVFSHTNLSGNRSYSWPYYICGKKNRYGTKSCPGRAVNARKVDALILDTVLNRVLTINFFQDVLTQTQAELTDESSYKRDLKQLEKGIIKTENAISNLLDLAEKGIESAYTRLQARQAELAVLRTEHQALLSKKAASLIKIPPETLEMVLELWKGKIDAARNELDVRELRAIIFGNFINKIELGYDTARIHYAFPLGELASGAAGAAAAGSIVINIQPDKISGRRRTTGSPNLERDQQIYELHKAGMKVREVAEKFGLSEARVWAICWKMRKKENKPSESPQNTF